MEGSGPGLLLSQMVLSRRQNAGQNHDIKLADRFLKMWHNSDICERE
jgi:hypothetical protein